MPDQTPHSQTAGEMIEIADARTLVSVVHKYQVDKPKTTIMMARGSEILCAKSMPDGSINVWVRRPIADDAPMAEIGVWCVSTGEPMPSGDFAYYLDTCMVLRPASVVAPGKGPDILVWHVFVLVDSLINGEVKIVA